MNKIVPSLITIIALALLSSLSLTPGDAGNTAALPKELRLKKIVSWGYGCGGHCAFNFSGTSMVTMTFKIDRTVRVSDTGEFIRQSNYPDGIQYHTRKWNMAHQGTWTGEKGKRTLLLKREKSDCTITEESGTDKKIERCPKETRERTLTCTIELVKIIGSIKEINRKDIYKEARALRCEPVKSSQGYSGTQFPWVFGIDKNIETHLLGEPHPIEYYLAN